MGKIVGAFFITPVLRRNKLRHYKIAF